MHKISNNTQNLINLITIGIAINEEPAARMAIKAGDTVVFKQMSDSAKVMTAYMEHGAPRSLVHCSIFVSCSPYGRDYKSMLGAVSAMRAEIPETLWDELSKEVPESSIVDGREYEITELREEIVDEFSQYQDPDGTMDISNPDIPDELISRDMRLLTLRDKETGKEFNLPIGVVLGDFAYVRTSGTDLCVPDIIREIAEQQQSGVMHA